MASSALLSLASPQKAVSPYERKPNKRRSRSAKKESEARALGVLHMLKKSDDTEWGKLSHALDRGVSKDEDMSAILKANRLWALENRKASPGFFDSTAHKQTPKWFYIGCSDSRVPAATVMGLSAGDVFVHRNVGALAPGNDLNSLSALEYAVAVLKVEHIIVVGHYDCGAVRASMQRRDHGRKPYHQMCDSVSRVLFTGPPFSDRPC